ncbi:MAG: decaprenyl-phosphate phosphoribosyltransferase [Acidimicrobiales bacterium]|nr:decaprenyl-phosphate phosphoribosyltransferase [Acidimicrobiales bacterium]
MSATSTAQPAATSPGLGRSLLKQARPRQWVKNVLVFAAPGAAGVLDNADFVVPTVVMFVAFCMVASGGYYWNDLLDVEADRNHPTKRHRPIASGAIPLRVAWAVGSVLLVGGVALAAVASWKACLAAAAYVALTATYSAVFKHIAVVDLVVVAAFFVIRAIGGAVAADVPMSTWFLLTTSFASLFIVSGKRFAELREVGDDAQTRATLDQYTLRYLRDVVSISLASAMVTYCIWAFDTKEIAGTSWPFYELSIVPMAVALLRYLLILEQGHGAAPEEIFLADRTMQVLGVVWAVVFGLGVYLS